VVRVALTFFAACGARPPAAGWPVTSNFIGAEISQPARVNWPMLLTSVPFSFTFLNKMGAMFVPVILAGRLGV
jgi:hypothetical protein